MSRIVFFLAAAMLAMSCGVTEAEVTTDATGTASQDLSSNACRWQCDPCPPNRYCTMSCRQIGNCGSACTAIGLCIEGYHWDDTACACLPNAGGEPCGDKVCGAGMVCCNASCGICTPPDGACIQIACDSTTLIQ